VTCIIVASSGEETVLVADRRLTLVDGQVDEDDAGKTVLLVTQNFRFMVAFTGLAKLGAFKTIDWLNTKEKLGFWTRGDFVDLHRCSSPAR